MNDSELLQYIRKLIEEKSETLQGRTAWQEHLDRHTTVSAKSIQASEIIRGFSGSWASIYSAFPSDERLEKIADQRTPPNPSKEFLKIGQSGVPEINFAPYDHHTNRQGMKGTSLIGHPISFEVIGTTVKSSACDWQFIAEDNSIDPLQGDTLRIDIESSLLSPSGLYSPSANSWDDAYGLDSVNPIPTSGLYLIVSHTGEKPPLIDGVNPCGLGDGFIANDGVAPTSDPTKPRNAVLSKGQYSKYEIFRVVDINPDVPGGLLTLDTGKRLKDFFTFDGSKSNIIRSITLIAPKATRLVTIPQSGEWGRERAFVVVPPEKSSVSDLSPPFMGQKILEGSWVQGGFDPNDPYLLGDSAHYKDSINLPIPRVLGEYSAYLEKESQGLSQSANISRLFGSFGSEITVGQVIHIFKKEIDLSIEVPLTTDPFGWYEVISNEGEYLFIKKVTEVNPETGVKNYQPIVVKDNADVSFVGLTYTVTFHLHDPISTLHLENFDIDAVEHARLDNLIDPTWVEESGRNQESGQNTLYSKSDRAIFNTQSTNDGASGTNADPGSLLDLGFRMVLFPAKLVNGELVADFDKPIPSRECILDTTIEDQEQYIHIDYSNGLVLLSHEPKWKTTLFLGGKGSVNTFHENDVNPNFVTDENGRIVLFASCVPYSRELGQLGSAIRVTASTVDFTNDHEEQNDIYGKRISFDIQAGQTIASQSYNSQVILSTLDSDNLLPDTGYIEILHSAETIGASNEPAFTVIDGTGNVRRVSTFIYHQKKTVTSGGTDYTALVGVLGGGSTGSAITISTDGEYKIILRKNVRPMCDEKGVCGVSYQEDTTHGSSKRFGTIRFKNSDIIQNKDGSVTIDVGVTPSEITTTDEKIELSGEFVLLPKGPTTSNGSGESRWVDHPANPTIQNLNTYPTDTPLYEFSGGYGKGYLRRGYPIKPSGYFNFNSETAFYTPPSEEPFIVDQTYFAGTSLSRNDLPINSGVCSGNLSVGYRHINSRESSLYSSQHRRLQVVGLRDNHKNTHYRNSMKRQMRVLEGMVIEDVTNGTFFTVGNKGMISTVGNTKRTTLTLNNSVPNVADGDTIYVSSGLTTKKVEFVFRNVADPAIAEEILIGSDTYQSINNLVLKGNEHPDMISNDISFDIERYAQDFYLHTYYSELTSGVSATVANAYGLVYDNPTDFNGYRGLGGSIVGATGSSAPTIEREYIGFHTFSDPILTLSGLVSKSFPSWVISSGDRASLFWTFYDPTKTANINIKDKLFIGYLDFDNSTVYLIEVTHTPGTTLKGSLNNICLQINSLARADYQDVSHPFPFPNPLGTSYSPFRGVEARMCHIEEGVAHNRYAIEIRSEAIGTNGNRWFLSTNSNLGNNDGIVSLVSKTFNSSNYDTGSATWTTHANVGGGNLDPYNIDGFGNVWFFDGGKECEINYDLHSHQNTSRLPNQTGTGDRTDLDKARKPLAGHHYRVIPNVEFVPILGEKGLNGGLIPPYRDPSDPTSTITNAHAIFYDTRYNFKSTDIGKKVYLSGTDTYAYVGWWEILGILPNYTIPQNVLENDPITVAIVKKHNVEDRDETKDLLMYGLNRKTNRGQLPLTYRSPIVRMGFDVLTNGQGGIDNHEPFGFFKYWDKVNPLDASYSDLSVTIQLAINGSEAKVQQMVVPKQDLATGTLFGSAPSTSNIVFDAVSLADFCNADSRLNGSRFRFSDGSTGAAFITWVVEKDSEYKNGNALYATYNLYGLTQVQIDSLLGADGILQINFLSRQDGMFFKDDLLTYGPPVGLNDPTAIGFVSHLGHNSEFDTCLGDRNSAFAINPFEIIDAASNPFTQPSPVLGLFSRSACNGIRWVISEPLTDRYNGSYVHMKRQNDFLYSGLAWNSAPAIKTEEQPIIETQETFRINKCPSTNQFLLGGDVEVFHTEVNGIINETYSANEPIYRHPIAYSALGLMGVWKDGVTGALPNTTSLNYSPTYKLQLANKERIVTISLNNMSSNSLFGTQVGNEETGTGGLGSKIINTVAPQMTLSAETPFKLFSQSNIQRSSIWGVDAIGTGFGSPDNTRTEREIWNSDNIFGHDLNLRPHEIPHYYYSLYSWSPNSNWWQLQLPNIQENDQVNASTPPPTLRVDLTEYFTQSLVDGNTNPKGIRLNKLWVNFGVWGDYRDSEYSVISALPGAPADIVGLGAIGTKPTPDPDEVIKRNHISFNLIVELPQKQTNRLSLEKQRGILTVIGSVAEADLSNPIIRLGTENLIAISKNTNTGVSNTINDYDLIVGTYVFDSGTGTWNWTPFDTQQLARSISDTINIIYKNDDLTPSAENCEVQAQALYNKVYWENSNPEGGSVAPFMPSVIGNYLYRPYTRPKFTNSGNDSLLFGDRGATASSSHLMNLDTLQPLKTIVVPLYVNREGGDLMPNVMEQQLDIGIGRYSTMGENISADWNNGDPTSGFGYSDYTNLTSINDSATTDNVIRSPYQLKTTHTNYYSKYSLIGNPLVPVVWGGIDFDSANNNFIQKTNSTYATTISASATSVANNTHNGWNGLFTSPFAYSGNAPVLSGQSPRLSRLSGGLRGEFSSNNFVNGDVFSREASRYPYEGPASLNANAMTGIVLTHRAIYPMSTYSVEGDEISPAFYAPSIGTSNIRARNARSCPHSFTIALTPMAQKFSPPTDERGRRSSVGLVDLNGTRFNPLISERLSDFGRYLDPDNEQNLVGNWLGEILAWANGDGGDGSSLPQGARVFLEVSTNLGDIDSGVSNNGVWVGSVKCSFDVETDFGTTQNKLIDEE